MIYALILLLLLLFAPWMALAVGMGLVLILPAYLAVSSLFTIVTAPSQVLAIATDKTTRRAHALEHATVNVLEEWFGSLPGVSGMATRDGFYLWGAEGFHPSTLIRAAEQGLTRMRRGESGLALHPRCGTSLIVARFVFAAAFLMLLVATGYFSLLNVLVAMMAAWLLGKPLGLVVQRYFTTSADVAAVHMSGIAWDDWPKLGAVPMPAIRRGAYFLRTAQLTNPRSWWQAHNGQAIPVRAEHPRRRS